MKFDYSPKAGAGGKVVFAEELDRRQSAPVDATRRKVREAVKIAEDETGVLCSSDSLVNELVGYLRSAKPMDMEFPFPSPSNDNSIIRFRS